MSKRWKTRPANITVRVGATCIGELLETNLGEFSFVPTSNYARGPEARAVGHVRQVLRADGARSATWYERSMPPLPDEVVKRIARRQQALDAQELSKTSAILDSVLDLVQQGKRLRELAREARREGNSSRAELFEAGAKIAEDKYEALLAHQEQLVMTIEQKEPSP